MSDFGGDLFLVVMVCIKNLSYFTLLLKLISDIYCLIYEETDESQVEVITLPSFSSWNSQVEEYAYPKPGTFLLRFTSNNLSIGRLLSSVWLFQGSEMPLLHSRWSLLMWIQKSTKYENIV